MSLDFDPRDPVGPPFRTAVSAELSSFLGQRERELSAMDLHLTTLTTLADTYTGGGKRLRPGFCWWSYIAAGGSPERAVIRASAALDLLHVSALVHDDVMDGSDTRRGVPSAHRMFEAQHRDQQAQGSAESFGRAGAILLGDLLLMWSDQMFVEAGLSPAALTAAMPLVHAVRTEVTAGQFLDVLAQTLPAADHEQAVTTAARVVEYKSARYTVQRPCQIGAALAGAPSETIEALARFGSPLGRAFQYRDDLLGVFGDPLVTGKPAGDDLREGKRTMMVAYALADAPGSQAAELEEMLGDPSLTQDQIERAREIITDCGARQQVEHTIERGLAEALETLDGLPLTDAGRTALATLAHASVRRDS